MVLWGEITVPCGEILTNILKHAFIVVEND
jgi:anti-sigma regulatory factor (Ser/Thr protein kinase)